jgi:uncharacterized DUF497 family protein
MEFRWNAWNREQAAKHGVGEFEAEHVVRFARAPYPMRHRRDTWLMIGKTDGGRFLEVVYLLDSADSVYIIHAMPLGRRRIHRRRKRRGRRR